MSFKAKWKGECELCDEMIVPGQEVEFDIDRNLMHVFCPNNPSGAATPREICPSCFLELPVSGVCSCRE